MKPLTASIILLALMFCAVDAIAENIKPAPYANIDPGFVPRGAQGREKIICGTKHWNCKHAADGVGWECDDTKDTADNPALFRHCCVDPECTKKDWCGVIVLDKPTELHDYDYVRLKTNKEVWTAMPEVKR